MEDVKDGTLYPNEAPEPPTKAEAPRVEIGEPQEPTIGAIMKDGTRKAIAGLVVLMLAAAYLGGLVYAEVHGLNMLRSGVASDLVMWAYIGMVSLGVLALALPLGLHFWAFDPTQRIAMYLCYAVDLALLGINAFTDMNVNEGQQLVQWAQMYKDYIVPTTPVIAMLMATTLLLLDPHARAFVMQKTMNAAIMQKKANEIMKAASDPRLNKIVEAAAQKEVENALSELFGAKVTAYSMNSADLPTRRGLLSSFFGYLLDGVRRLFSDNMQAPSEPNNSDRRDQA